MHVPASDADRGRKAAQTLWRLGLAKATIDDPLTPEFARAALAELELLQQGTPGALREVLEGAQMSAEQLSVESFHGLIEVVQNADDLRATEVRVAVRKARNRSYLLIAHDGERVQLGHVVAMTLAFVSTKRDDPRSMGRFGIGLKTLGRLGESLTVHCAPYHFTIEGNHVHAASGARSIAGFYDAGSTATLLELRLRQGFDFDDFRAWFAGLGSESIVFLDTVRSLRLVDLARGNALSQHRLRQASVEYVDVPGIKERCRRTVLREPRGGGSWDRYEIERKMPPALRRRHKARNEATPLAVAVPEQTSQQGRVYAGLPLGLSTGLPLSLNAQFDIDIARRGIQHEELNAWLLEQLAQLTAAAALDRLIRDPATAWKAIPLRAEQAVLDDAWLSPHIAEFIDVVQARVRRSLRITIGGQERRIRNLAFESEPLDGLLRQQDVDGLRQGLSLLPQDARDREGRWRAVLVELSGAIEIDVHEALELLDWNDEDLGSRDVHWFIKLARAAIEADLGERLWSQRSVVTAGGTRIVPPMAHVEGELLLRSELAHSLASRLGLAHVIDQTYLSRWSDAVVVRKWLEEHEMLRDAADPESTLRALGSRDESEEPLHLRDEDLLLLRDEFSGVDERVRQELGAGVGRAITVDVQQWQGARQTTQQGRPAEAYLPASIEDRKDGWSRAAGKTPGLAWIHPRYKDVLRRPGRRRAGSGEPRRLAARGLFGLLGAEVGPRLIEPASVESKYDVPASPIEPGQAPDSQRAVLRGLERHATHLKDDFVSPDLVAVLRHLQRERTLRARRERARTLLAILEREWARLYALHTTANAVWSDYGWYSAGTVPATWLAAARDEPWLTSEDGKKKSPPELAVRTPATEAIYGDDRGSFAYELDEGDASSPVVRALGIATDPEVSEMVSQLAALRDRADPVDERAITLRYAAISAACKKA